MYCFVWFFFSKKGITSSKTKVYCFVCYVFSKKGITSSRTKVHVAECIVLQGMFSVTSAVHHLKPEYILQHVLEAEDTQWSTAHLESDPPTNSAGTPPSILTSPSPDLSDPGQLLLRSVNNLLVFCIYYSMSSSSVVNTFFFSLTELGLGLCWMKDCHSLI